MTFSRKSVQQQLSVYTTANEVMKSILLIRAIGRVLKQCGYLLFITEIYREMSANPLHSGYNTDTYSIPPHYHKYIYMKPKQFKIQF